MKLWLWPQKNVAGVMSLSCLCNTSTRNLQPTYCSQGAACMQHTQQVSQYRTGARDDGTAHHEQGRPRVAGGASCRYRNQSNLQSSLMAGIASSAVAHFAGCVLLPRRRTKHRQCLSVDRQVMLASAPFCKLCTGVQHRFKQVQRFEKPWVGMLCSQCCPATKAVPKAVAPCTNKVYAS